MLDMLAISANLERGEDGIWYGKHEASVSYPSDGNELCFAVEDRSFWFRHRNNCILSMARLYPPANRGAIFDVGGGNGCVSAALAAAGFEVALIEPGRAGAANAKRRGLETVICATTDSAQLTPNSLPAVGLFDVVEHIEDDLAFLRSIRRLMMEQGRLYITVPAFSFLWSQDDIAAGHYRRYTREGISQVLERAGFEVEFSSYIFRFLPLPIALLRALPHRLGWSSKEKATEASAREHATRGGVVARLLDRVLESEISRLVRGKPMRFGGSCLLVAKPA